MPLLTFPIVLGLTMHVSGVACMTPGGLETSLIKSRPEPDCIVIPQNEEVEMDLIEATAILSLPDYPKLYVVTVQDFDTGVVIYMAFPNLPEGVGPQDT